MKDNEGNMMNELNILDRLENEKGFVRMVLTSGEIVYGTPEIICWAEDDDGLDTIPEIMFKPYFNPYGVKKFYREDDIVSYNICDEKDILKNINE